MHAGDSFGGGGQIRFARVLRFCTMAARWNSSDALERPRRRIRFKAVVGLQVCKAHLDLLALVSRFIEGRSPHQHTRMVAGVFVDVAWDLARRGVGTTPRFERTCVTVALEREIPNSVVRANAARRRE